MSKAVFLNLFDTAEPYQLILIFAEPYEHIYKKNGIKKNYKTFNTHIKFNSIKKEENIK